MVEGDYAEGEGVGLGVGVAGGLEEGFHGFAGGELFDGAAEVFVGVALAGEEAGEFGEDAVEVPAVGGAEGA